MQNLRLLFKQVMRKCDSFGCGHYGASRGTRKHSGVDILSHYGEHIASPIDGTITKLGYCYADDLSYRYIEITNGNDSIRVLYVHPSVKVGQKVKRLAKIGTTQDLNKRYKGIPLHIHIEIRQFGKLIDPTKFIDFDEN